MQEKIKATSVITAAKAGRTVTIYLQSEFIVLSGTWQWDMQAEAVFCSDVILSIPLSFVGVRAIIYPEDVSLIKEKLAATSPSKLEFRIITTYGEVKQITGYGIRFEKKQDGLDELRDHLFQSASEDSEDKKEFELLRLLHEVHEKSEINTSTGTWWYNATTNEVAYSAQVFRIYDLAPFSVNMHLNTFNRYIHKEDSEPVVNAVEKAVARQLPLHLEYRIVTAVSEKYISLTSQWFFNSRGEWVMSATVQDISPIMQLELQREDAVATIGFYRQQLLQNELFTHTGHWQVNLLTRKTEYSENYYRLFGLRAKFVPPGLGGFINNIHPEDQEAFKLAHKKMLLEHKVPELDFRVVRSDGKVRFMIQTARLVTVGNELVMMGMIRDLTVSHLLETKIEELSETQLIHDYIHEHIGDLSNLATWIWDTNSGKIKWSEQFYRITGFKSGSDVTSNQLLQLIHPSDQKLFSDQLVMILQQRKEGSFSFRMLVRGKIKNMKAFFRLLKTGERELFIGIMQDITGEFELQNELGQRMQLAEALSENILDRVIITDINNTILLWNRESEKTYGMDKDDVIGKNFFDVFPKLRSEETLVLFNKALKGESISLRAQKSILGKGYYDLHLLPLWDSGTVEPNGIIHIIHDVTKETQLNHTLNDRLGFIENLVEASVDRIIALDKNLNYLVWNQKCEQYYGLKKEQVLGKNLLEVFPQTLSTPSYADLRRVLKGETIHIPALQGQGYKDHHEVYLIPVKNEREEITAILWILHDLSKEVEAENKIMQQAGLLQAVFDASLHGIILLRAIRDEKGIIEDYKVVLNNNTTREWNGRDLTGKRYCEEFPGVHTHGIFEDYNRLLDNGEPVDRELLYKEGGIEAWYRITAVRINNDELVTTAENITVQKKAEEEKIKNLTVLQHAEELAAMGSWEYDIVKAKFTWSAGMYQLFNLQEGDKITPAIYLDFVVEEDKPKALFIINALENQPGDFEEVIRIKTAKGQRLIRIKGSVVYDNFNKPARMIGVDLDITEIREAQDKIQQSENLLRQTTLATPDAITIYDLEKKQPAYLNNCLAEWTGYTIDELVNMGYDGRLNLIHHADRKKLIAFNEGMLSAEDGTVNLIEYRLQTKKGLFWIRNRSKVFKRNDEGKPSHILSVLQDFTEEVKLREMLIRRTRYAEAIIDASIDRIVVYDRELKIIAWNKRSELVTGLKREQVIGKKISEILPSILEDNKTMEALQKSIEGQYSYLPPGPSIDVKGYFESFFIPLTDDTQETYAVLTLMHEVTDLIQRENELKDLNRLLEIKNTELEQKHEEITNFSFIASHDLKEPLRKIHTFSDWLMENEKEKVSPIGQSFIIKMRVAVKRMEMLIDDIMVLTRIHSDRTKDDKADLNMLLEEAKADIGTQLKQTHTVIEADDLPVITANSRQVCYLFRNLISNAIKFQKPGNVPHLTIKAENIKGATLDIPGAKKDYLKLSFTDNGFGFDCRYSKRIFQVFQRLHDKYEFEGTGIGLAICKKIMENHEGLITAQSETGKGSVFTCYFPLPG